MLHIILDPNDTTAWMPNFVDGLAQALQELGVKHEFRTDLPTRYEGPVFLTRHFIYDLLLQTENPPEQVIIHEHDVWNPFTNAVDPKSLWIFKHPSVKVIALTNPSMVPWAERCLPPGSRAKVIAAGFPYSYRLLEKIQSFHSPDAPREKLVIFPGRMNEFYQPYTSARLAFEFMERGYRAIIASPIDPQSHYPVSLWQELGVEVGRFPQEEYYRLLARAKAAISCTIGGSLTLALYEAHLLGAMALAPADPAGRPPFTEMYHPTWDILNPRQVIDMVERGTSVSIDTTWFDRRAYVQRILAALG